MAPRWNRLCYADTEERLYCAETMDSIHVTPDGSVFVGFSAQGTGSVGYFMAVPAGDIGDNALYDGWDSDDNPTNAIYFPPGLTSAREGMDFCLSNEWIYYLVYNSTGAPTSDHNEVWRCSIADALAGNSGDWENLGDWGLGPSTGTGPPPGSSYYSGMFYVPQRDVVLYSTDQNSGVTAEHLMRIIECDPATGACTNPGGELTLRRFNAMAALSTTGEYWIYTAYDSVYDVAVLSADGATVTCLGPTAGTHQYLDVHPRRGGGVQMLHARDASTYVAPPYFVLDGGDIEVGTNPDFDNTAVFWSEWWDWGDSALYDGPDYFDLSEGDQGSTSFSLPPTTGGRIFFSSTTSPFLAWQGDWDDVPTALFELTYPGSGIYVGSITLLPGRRPN